MPAVAAMTWAVARGRSRGCNSPKRLPRTRSSHVAMPSRRHSPTSPGLALWLSATVLPAATRRRIVAIAASGYTGLVTAGTLQWLRGNASRSSASSTVPCGWRRQ